MANPQEIKGPRDSLSTNMETSNSAREGGWTRQSPQMDCHVKEITPKFPGELHIGVYRETWVTVAMFVPGFLQLIAM